MTGLARLEVGSVFAGQFRVLGPLGEGGMGALYVVEQVTTGRSRALKVMHPRLAGDVRGRERFAQEAQVGARIESEHVVEVIGAGIDEATGTPWLAMELLHGETLAEAVARRGPLATGDILEVFKQLCHAVAAAHRAGVVHRDLKPENVFLARARRSDALFVVKVLDLGIARWIQDNRAAATATSAIGSPLWMAPEQFDHRGKISPATDVWALGLIAYYLLTGRQYWHAADADSFSLPALVSEIVVASIEPASQRARATGVREPTLGPAFDAWFARCVHRDPEARFANAAELIAALPAALAEVAGAPGERYEPPPERRDAASLPGTGIGGEVRSAPHAPTIEAAPPTAGTQPMHTLVAPPPVASAVGAPTARPSRGRARAGAAVAGALALAAAVFTWGRSRSNPPPASASAACPGDQHASAGHCCAGGQEWVPAQGACVCIDPARCGLAPASAPLGAGSLSPPVANVVGDGGAEAPSIVGARDAAASPDVAAATEGACVGQWYGVQGDRELRLTVRMTIDRAYGPECGRIQSNLEYLISPLPPARSVQRLLNCTSEGDRLLGTEIDGRQRHRFTMRCVGDRATYSSGVAPMRLTRR